MSTNGADPRLATEPTLSVSNRTGRSRSADRGKSGQSKVRVSKYKTWAFKKLVLSSWNLSRISSQISGVERKVPSKRSPAVSDKNARVTCCPYQHIFYLLPKQGRDFFYCV